MFPLDKPVCPLIHPGIGHDTGEIPAFLAAHSTCIAQRKRSVQDLNIMMVKDPVDCITRIRRRTLRSLCTVWPHYITMMDQVHAMTYFMSNGIIQFFLEKSINSLVP